MSQKNKGSRVVPDGRKLKEHIKTVVFSSVRKDLSGTIGKNRLSTESMFMSFDILITVLWLCKRLFLFLFFDSIH